MFRPIFILASATCLLSGCAENGLRLGLGLNRAIANSMERTRSAPEASEFVTVDGVPMTVTRPPDAALAFVRVEPGTATIAMMVQGAQSATGCAAAPLGDVQDMTGIAPGQPLDAPALRALGGAAQMALTC